MTKDEALKLALEMFESMSHEDSIFYGEFDDEIAAIKEALAQPEQGLVVCKHEWFSTGAMEPRECRCIKCGAWNTTPPQRTWVDLTDGVMCDIAIEHGLMSIDWIDFARAIEAKLKEKNT